MDSKVKLKRLAHLDALHQRKRKQHASTKDNNHKKHSNKRNREKDSKLGNEKLHHSNSSKGKRKERGRPPISSRQSRERERDDALGGEAVSKQVLESLGVKQKAKERDESQVQDLLDELLQSNPKHHHAVRSTLLRDVWQGKLADKTLSFENPASAVSLAQAQKKALKHKLSNCLAVREKPRERKRFLETILQSKKQKKKNESQEEQNGKEKKGNNLSWEFGAFLPLHEQWLEYASKWYEQNKADLKDALSKIELCGASIKVLRSSSPHYCNVEGYVVDVMSHSFRIVSKKNRLQTVPLQGCLFRVEVAKHFSFLIQGDQALERKVFHQT
jgi:RNase P/RNase MRP subunit p29